MAFVRMGFIRGEQLCAEPLLRLHTSRAVRSVLDCPLAASGRCFSVETERAKAHNRHRDHCLAVWLPCFGVGPTSRRHTARSGYNLGALLCSDTCNVSALALEEADSAL